MFNTYIVILDNYIYNYIVRHSRISNCLSTIDNCDLTVTNQSLSGFTIRIISFGIIPDSISFYLYIPPHRRFSSSVPSRIDGNIEWAIPSAVTSLKHRGLTANLRICTVFFPPFPVLISTSFLSALLPFEQVLVSFDYEPASLLSVSP